MIVLREIIGIALVSIGLGFLCIGALGLRRFSDTLSRLHIVGLVDTLGAPLVLLGAGVHLGVSFTTAKIVLASIFLYVTSPLVGHMLGRIELEGRPDGDGAGDGRGSRPGAADAASLGEGDES